MRSRLLGRQPAHIQLPRLQPLLLLRRALLPHPLLRVPRLQLLPPCPPLHLRPPRLLRRHGGRLQPRPPSFRLLHRRRVAAVRPAVPGDESNRIGRRPPPLSLPLRRVAAALRPVRLPRRPIHARQRWRPRMRIQRRPVVYTDVDRQAV